MREGCVEEIVRRAKSSDDVGLVLGLVGAITGVSSLLIHCYEAFEKRPRIRATIRKLEHDTGSGKANFWTELEMVNLWDRKININDLDVSLRTMGKSYRPVRLYFKGYSFDQTKKTRWIEPHEAAQAEADFSGNLDGGTSRRLRCIITLRHRYGTERLRATSSPRLGKQPSVPI
jgi:hypothetical protein